ncbi:hypothetical protein VNO77_35124 [Canavalia gladiata]|uniref:CCT domain-containing protein n=1 Tax=Canavalia gladiata TaxID=3824 RepID=A0AAN9KEV9_CANGL
MLLLSVLLATLIFTLRILWLVAITVCLFFQFQVVFGEQEHGFMEEEEVVDEEEDEAEAASWLLPNPLRNNDKEGENDEVFLFGDEYLDLVDCNSCGHGHGHAHNQFSDVRFDDHHQQNYNAIPHSYAVVPVQCGAEVAADVQHHAQHFQPGLDFESSRACFSYDGSLSQSVSFFPFSLVSVSSMDVGIVPESTISDISKPHSKSPTGTSDLFPPLPMPSLLTPMDREARVLRYREKRKTRKFEKKIRYASRKAYAETRPRIKGRFAKKTDVEAEVDQMLSTTLITEAGCSIVPSF